MPPKYDFYEVVRIIRLEERYAPIVECEGTILGQAQNEDDWSYAVAIENTGVTWYLPESALVPTGRRPCRSDFYNGEAVKVGVTHTGEGFLME